MTPFEKIEKATVMVTQTGGQGVLVPGNFILTATHCINWDGHGGMALGDHFIEEIEAPDSQSLKVAPLAVDAVSDIAVLGALDNQEFASEADEFEAFCEDTAPVSLCTVEHELFKPIPFHVWTHTRIWLTGEAQQCAPGAQVLAIETTEQIEGGTSGGPIVNELGQLLAIVSNASIGDSRGRAPRPHLALPVWIMNVIRSDDQGKTNGLPHAH